MRPALRKSSCASAASLRCSRPISRTLIRSMGRGLCKTAMAHFAKVRSHTPSPPIMPVYVP